MNNDKGIKSQISEYEKLAEEPKMKTTILPEEQVSNRKPHTRRRTTNNNLSTRVNNC